MRSSCLALCVLVTAACAQTLVVNGGFERNSNNNGGSPRVNGWTVGGNWGPVTNPIAGGQYSAPQPALLLAKSAGLESPSVFADKPCIVTRALLS